MIGRTLAHYKITGRLGAGGMGEVYLAHDTKLKRDVALKVLPESLARHPERQRRFEREASAIAALKHPNIVTVHSIEQAEGVHFITMELVDGPTLSDIVPENGLAVDEFLDMAEPLADALESAHVKGIIHRDLKPANIMRDADGRLKILDFGLAKLFESGDDLETNKTVADGDTREGQVLGTLSYMSPEQAEGRQVDHRSDIFSLGIVLYEMATGERPFKGATELSALSSVLRDEPSSISDIKKAFPRELSRIIGRCLEKDPNRRYQSAADLAAELRKYRETQSKATTNVASLLRQPRVALPAIILLLAIAAVAAWSWQRSSKMSWAREVALPEAERLADASSYDQGLGYWEAFQLAREAAEYIPDDPALEGLFSRITNPHTIHSTPPGARVYVKPYAGPDLAWEYLGETPIDTLRYVSGLLRMRIEKDGFEPMRDILWGRFFVSDERGYVLREAGNVPEGMTFIPDSAGVLHIPAAPAGLHLPGVEHLPGQRTGDFFMDVHEVTNAQYKEFMNAGGYANREYWKHPFERDGNELGWDEAMALFVDKTGRPGPATWEVGDYLDGQGDYPVGGLSWFEAAAYAEWAGKSLPTIYHWDRAALTWASGFIVPLSNFSGKGPVPVGSTGATNRFGTYDLGGNLREWCANESSRGGRFILGGAWSDPVYAFNDAYAQPTFDRSPTNGFRCIRYIGDVADRDALEQPIRMPFRDFMQEPMVSEETFSYFLKIFDYDKTELDAAVTSAGENEDWVRQKITFNAAYGNERMMAYLFLPRNSTPPYQTVIYFPGSGAIHSPSSEHLTPGARADFILKSGRAFLFPIYKSTFERGDDLKSDYPEVNNFWKEHVVMWQKDLSRCIDYLETRDDIDSDKIAYLGASWGAAMAPMMIAPEPRIKVGIVLVAGILFHESLPEVEPMHYLPRVKVPMLMLNGKYDFFFPYETAQVPFFKLLGTPDEDKRMLVNESGHSFPRTEAAKESLAWLDRYLGEIQSTKP